VSAGSVTAAGLLLALGMTACGKSTHTVDAANVPPNAGGAPMQQPPEVMRTCGDTAHPGPSPLRRLSTFQIRNTFRDLFTDAPAVIEAAALEIEKLPPQLSGEVLQPPTELTVERYHAIAHAAAEAASGDDAVLATVAGCMPGADGDAACRDGFLARFLELAYRRPVSEDELLEMQRVFETGQELGADFASGVRAVVEVVLQGPDFLYLLEQGEGDVLGDVVALAPYETATRLAYFITGSMPDPELLASASAGFLGVADLEAHARRLLGAAGSRRVTRHFFEQLLRLDSVSGSELAQLAREETGQFVEHVTFDGAGTFQALFSEPSTFANRQLAELYGLEGISGDAFQRVALDATQRAGVLTQSAFLRATSPGENSTRPVLRGVAVLNQVLCVELPPPPPDVNVPLPEIPADATRRQQLEIATQEAACQNCHRNIDPIGFAFEHYDAAGRWRTEENGKSIDSSGTLRETDAQGSFADAVELTQLIAQSDDAKACFAKNWFRYSHAREATEQDACALEQLEAALRDSDGSVVELLVALAKTDQLRYRLAHELGR
jgi:hypothetical protein